MNSKILVVAFAGLSLLAAAQSSGTQQKPASDQKSAAQSDRAAQQKGVVHRDLATRNTVSEKKDGKTTATDDWHQTAAKTSGSSNAAVADVNGDGHADLAQTPGPKVVDVKAGDLNGDGRPDVNAKNSGHATEQNAIVTSESNVKSPRDIATGQASGKRQHKPLTVTKEVDKASPKVAPSK